MGFIGGRAALAAALWILGSSSVLHAAYGPLAADEPKGGDGSITLSFASTAESVQEGGPPLAVQVVLHTTDSPTTKAASVTVFDRLKGDASSGSDYKTFAPKVVTFPSGSVDGALATVWLVALDDLLVEGKSEKVSLGLKDAAGGSARAQSSFTATIQDANTATIRFAGSAIESVGEGDVVHSVVLELDLGKGVKLGAAAGALVYDSATGTATAGADYKFSAQPVSFAAGSADGAVHKIILQVVGDQAQESGETVVLALKTPAGGTTFGEPDQYQLTITDDDSGPKGNATLDASEGPTGVENALAQDDFVEIAAGPNAGTRVRIASRGGRPMVVSAPKLSGTDAGDFSVALESASLVPAVAGGQASDARAPDVLSPLERRAADGGLGIALALDRALLAELSALPRATVHGFPVPGLGDVTLELSRLPLPVASGAKLIVDGRDVAGGLEAVLGDLSLWNGRVLEVPDSHVFLALASEGSRGFLELPNTVDRIVHVVSEDGVPGACRVVSSDELAGPGSGQLPYSCEALLPPGKRAPGKPGTGGHPPNGGLQVVDCALAIETDYQLFKQFGSTSALSSYVAQLIAAVSEQYLEDVRTTMSIASLGVHTSASDPWHAQDAGGSATKLLDEFASAWAPDHWPTKANLAHFLSGADLGGSAAYVKTLCDPTYGFAVSGNIGGASGLTWDFVQVAHGIGHNMGALHTESYCPPLDLCAANCTGKTQCELGTIMSLCHICGGMDNIELSFHPVTSDIIGQVIRASCLGPAELAAGNYLQFVVRFEPATGGGERSATLEFSHDAANQPAPFRIRLHGTAE